MSTEVICCRPFQAAVSCRTPTVPLLRSLVEAGVRLVEIVPLDVMPMSAGQRSARFAEIASNVREAGIGVWSVHVPFGGDWDISAADENRRLAAVDHSRSVIELCRLLRPR